MDGFLMICALFVLWIAACHWEAVIKFDKLGKSKIAITIWLTGLFIILVKLIN
jgi:hypothetical protein